MIFNLLTDKARWLRARDESMASARACRAALTDPNSYWRYPPDNTRVTEAVGMWVSRAWCSHQKAMAREPVIHNFIHVGPTITEGELYVG